MHPFKLIYCLNSGNENGCFFQMGGPDNLFVNYLSRIHREEVSDIFFIGLAEIFSNIKLLAACFLDCNEIVTSIFLVFQDFAFILKGITRLLNNPLTQTYLPGSCKKVQFHQELLVLFWKMCDINKVSMFLDELINVNNESLFL